MLQLFPQTTIDGVVAVSGAKWGISHRKVGHGRITALIGRVLASELVGQMADNAEHPQPQVPDLQYIFVAPSTPQLGIQVHFS